MSVAEPRCGDALRPVRRRGSTESLVWCCPSDADPCRRSSAVPETVLGAGFRRKAQQTVAVRINETGFRQAGRDIMAAPSQVLPALRDLLTATPRRALSISAIDGHEQGGEKQEVGDKRERDRDCHQDAERPAWLVSRRGEHQEAG